MHAFYPFPCKFFTRRRSTAKIRMKFETYFESVTNTANTDDDLLNYKGPYT